MKITEKGRAILAAIECGLIPEIDEKYDVELFLKFWDLYMGKLYNRLCLKSMFFSLIALISSTIALLII